VVEEHSAGEGVAGMRHIAVAEVEEVAGTRRIVVAAAGHHSFRTGVEEVHSSNRRILAEVGWSGSVTEDSECGGRKLLTDIAAEEGRHSFRTAAEGEALGSLPGYGSLGRGSWTCLRNDVDVEGAMS
jgi:hypothetical protein